ncbi:hypothetical protein [Candidatus Nanohalobium constans]|uniref:Uncharacterized protein n=1 Tax=Candidatus Nanohalobium constans TaxID=2565781 RepID=A0A5Q0UFU7_9ARCH|nr:hypothetical protein [Candidatus Nanohalobium constans]QGA80503.1 hypothetical protein LC1Nh_0609 [Candidatus Nanohalobium constans]
MAQEVEEMDLRRSIVDAKDGNERKFKVFTGQFYVMRSALRYFCVKKKMSFTSSKIADNFPVSAPVTGSCLKILEELGVVEARTESSSPNRYMPEDVNMERMQKVEEVLIDNYEIDEFLP